MKYVLKSALFAWGIPLAMLAVIHFFGLDSNRSLESFNTSRFKPVKKEIISGSSRGRRASSDHFELWLEAPDHSRYFIRDPEPEPIEQYFRDIPDDELMVSYQTGHEGDRIVNVMVAATGDTPISFDDLMKEEKARKRLVWFFAFIFSAMGNIFLYFAVVDWWQARKSAAALH